MISKYLKGFLKFMDRLEVVRLKVLDEIVVLRIKRNRKNKRFSLVFISFKIVRKSLQFDLELVGLKWLFKQDVNSSKTLKSIYLTDLVGC